MLPLSRMESLKSQGYSELEDSNLNLVVHYHPWLFKSIHKMIGKRLEDSGMLQKNHLADQGYPQIK